MNWKGQPVVVTGACGFIGSHLVEDLVRRGAAVRALTFYNARGSNGWLDDTSAEAKKSVHTIAGDLRDTEFVRRLIRADDMVFHLAALIGIPYSYEAPRSYIDTNITGTLNVLEAARREGAKRTLVISSSEVYGTALRVPIDEDHPLQAQSPYSATKIAAEKIAESYYRSFGMPVTIIRPFNTFGPRQSARAVIPTILMQLITGKPEIRLGDPTTTRDFNYVSDTVEGLVRLAECEAAIGRVVNIGTGTDVSIQHVAETAQRLLNCQAPLVTDPGRTRPPGSEVRRLCADNALLLSLTGWRPPSRMEDGLLRTIDWLKKEIGRYDPEKYYV
jgi:NAD dependent epimerase/dehydratase